MIDARILILEDVTSLGSLYISQDKTRQLLNEYLKPYRFEISKDYTSLHNIGNNHKYDVIDCDVLDNVETHIGHLSINNLMGYNSVMFIEDMDEKRIGSKTFELPYIAICRTDKKYGEYVVNQITSIYDKEKLESLIQRTYDANKKFYVNEKSRAFIKSAELQLPINLINALSTSYDKQCLTKSQVEQDLSKSKSYGSETQLDEVKEDVEEYEMDIAEDRW